MKKVTFRLETLTCPSCTGKIEKVLRQTKGINEVNVLFTSSKVKVLFDEEMVSVEEISKTIDCVGFDVLEVKIGG